MLESSGSIEVPSDLSLLELSIKIEELMYTKLEQSNYTQFARRRILMLQDKNNSDLRLSLISESLSAEDFVNRKDEDLLSNDIKEKLEEGIQWKMKA